jgi:hypothetical protein
VEGHQIIIPKRGLLAPDKTIGLKSDKGLLEMIKGKETSTAMLLVSKGALITITLRTIKLALRAVETVGESTKSTLTQPQMACKQKERIIIVGELAALIMEIEDTRRKPLYIIHQFRSQLTSKMMKMLMRTSSMRKR